VVHLTEKNQIGGTHKCRQCIRKLGKVDQMICSSCRSYLITSFKCSHCGRISYYLGIDEPVMCAGCTAIFPAFEVVKKNRTARIKYHIDPELY